MKRPIKQKNITRNEQFLYINSLSSEFHDRLKNYKKIPETVDDYESKISLTEKENMKRQLNEYSPQIAEYKDLYEKYKRLEKENNKKRTRL